MTVAEEAIISKIYLIRGYKVMIDRDLAGLYGVETKRLKEQVNRNLDRFPAHFMFELTKEENENLRSQNATLRHGAHSKYLPYAFTEHGVLMLSNVLKRIHPRNPDPAWASEGKTNSTKPSPLIKTSLLRGFDSDRTGIVAAGYKVLRWGVLV